MSLADVRSFVVTTALAEPLEAKADKTALSAETERAQNAEGALDTRLDALEGALPTKADKTAFDAFVAAEGAANQSLSDSIGAVDARVDAQDQTITQIGSDVAANKAAFDAFVIDEAAANDALANSIDDVNARALEAEGNLQDNIAAEAASRISDIAAVNGRVDNLDQSKADQSALDAFAASEAAANQALSASIAAVDARAQGVEAGLRTDVDAQAAAITQIDDAVTDNRAAFDAFVSDEAAANEALADSIAAADARAQSAESDLQDGIDAVNGRADALAAADAATNVRIDPIEALAPRYPDRAGDARSLFSSALTGDPLSRPIIAAGSVQSSPVGTVLRITGQDTDDVSGYVDIAPRIAKPIYPGRTYQLTYRLRRNVDPADPANNAIELRWQNLNQNKAHVSNVAMGSAITPAVADGMVTYSFLIGKEGAPGSLDYVIPPSAIYGLPLMRVFGNGQETDMVSVDVEDVTDQISGGADVSALSNRVGAVEDALPGKVSQSAFDAFMNAEAATNQSLSDAIAAEQQQRIDGLATKTDQSAFESFQLAEAAANQSLSDAIGEEVDARIEATAGLTYDPETVDGDVAIIIDPEGRQVGRISSDGRLHIEAVDRDGNPYVAVHDRSTVDGDVGSIYDPTSGRVLMRIDGHGALVGDFRLRDGRSLAPLEDFQEATAGLRYDGETVDGDAILALSPDGRRPFWIDGTGRLRGDVADRAGNAYLTALTAPYGQRAVYAPDRMRQTASRLRSIKLGATTTPIIFAMIGDSWTGSPLYWIRAFTEAMQAEYGDGGPGWTGFAFSSSGAIAGGARSDVTVTKSGSWTSNYFTGGSADAGQVSTVNAGDSYTVTMAGSAGITNAVLHASSGTLRYRWNGGAWTEIAISGDALQTFALAGVPAGGWTLDIEAVAGTVKISGIDLQKSGGGVRVHKLGKNGSNTAHWTSVPEADFVAGMTALGPHVVQVMHLTNDQLLSSQAPVSPAQHGANLTELVRRARLAAPAADMLLVTPPATRAQGSPQAAYATAARAAAIARACTHLDLQYAFGEAYADYAYGSGRALLDDTLIHPTQTFGRATIIDALIRTLTFAQ